MTGKGCDLGLHPSGAAEAFTGSTSFLCECVGLTYFSDHFLWGSHSGGMEPDWAQPARFYSITWGAGPTPDRMATATEQRGSPTSYATQALDPPTPAHPLSRGEQPAHSEERCGWCPY